MTWTRRPENHFRLCRLRRRARGRDRRKDVGNAWLIWRSRRPRPTPSLKWKSALSITKTGLSLLPGERIALALTSLDKRETFMLDVTRAQINSLKPHTRTGLDRRLSLCG